MSSQPLRARGKARRQAEIVAAAAELWRTQGIDKVSVNQIAAAAEVAPQTVYNLIGGVDAIGFGVLKVALAELDAAVARSTKQGIELALEQARLAVGIYTADAALYRQVLVRLPKVLFDGVHLGRDTADLSIRAMTQARDAGELRPGIDPERIGRAVYVNFLGTLYDWACGDSGDADFLRAAEIAVLAPAAACACDDLRPALTARLAAALSATGADTAVAKA